MCDCAHPHSCITWLPLTAGYEGAVGRTSAQPPSVALLSSLSAAASPLLVSAPTVPLHAMRQAPARWRRCVIPVAPSPSACRSALAREFTQLVQARCAACPAGGMPSQRLAQGRTSAGVTSSARGRGLRGSVRRALKKVVHIMLHVV